MDIGVRYRLTENFGLVFDQGQPFIQLGNAPASESLLELMHHLVRYASQVEAMKSNPAAVDLPDSAFIRELERVQRSGIVKGAEFVSQYFRNSLQSRYRYYLHHEPIERERPVVGEYYDFYNRAAQAHWDVFPNTSSEEMEEAGRVGAAATLDKALASGTLVLPLDEAPLCGKASNALQRRWPLAIASRPAICCPEAVMPKVSSSRKVSSGSSRSSKGMGGDGRGSRRVDRRSKENRSAGRAREKTEPGLEGKSAKGSARPASSPGASSTRVKKDGSKREAGVRSAQAMPIMTGGFTPSMSAGPLTSGAGIGIPTLPGSISEGIHRAADQLASMVEGAGRFIEQLPKPLGAFTQSFGRKAPVGVATPALDSSTAALWPPLRPSPGRLTAENTNTPQAERSDQAIKGAGETSADTKTEPNPGIDDVRSVLGSASHPTGTLIHQRPLKVKEGQEQRPKFEPLHASETEEPTQTELVADKQREARELPTGKSQGPNRAGNTSDSPETILEQSEKGRLVDVHWEKMNDRQRAAFLSSPPVLDFINRMEEQHGYGRINWWEQLRGDLEGVHVGYDNREAINVIATFEEGQTGDLRLLALEGVNGAGGRMLEYLKRKVTSEGRRLTLSNYSPFSAKFYLDHQLIHDHNNGFVYYPGGRSLNPVLIEKQFVRLGNVHPYIKRTMPMKGLLNWVARASVRYPSPNTLKEQLVKMLQTTFGDKLQIDRINPLTGDELDDGSMTVDEFVLRYLKFPSL